ncbi:hypothetical protein B9Z65_451 [Elsinoe australis]|uniref:Fe2OG dioxygenase domain-containing protein n=1 Tax=Elsinoe australis TaxID=40998 RepID=A0A2P8AIM5_9PEZI|nr:hypothetical protein B9Z65_451 [Elsinoe australis]
MPAITSKHNYNNIPTSLINDARVNEQVPFDASRHLIFEAPSSIHSLKDFELEECGISSMAVSEPFPLFSREAIQQFRAEILSQEVLETSYCPTGDTSGHFRGHCPKYARFTNDAWKCPEVVAIISKVAGVELVPAIDYDVGHVNISINGIQDDQEVWAGPGEQKEKSVSGYCESAFGWHTDSYAFVAVTMLSDCCDMIGGETKIRKGNGDIADARGPTMGTVVVMQGSCVPHKATSAKGGRERMTMVTSWRPRSPHMKDATIMRGTRNTSHLPTLYTQYTEYRLANLVQRARKQLKDVEDRKEADSGFDTEGVRGWLLEQRSYIDDMLREIQAV